MRRAALVATFLGLAACTEAKPYLGVPEKNLRVRTAVAGERVALEVHRLGASCTSRYEGSVALDQPLIEIGLPSDQPILLIFEFQRGGVLSRDAPIRKEVQVLARTGNRYEMRVAYKDPIHDIELREIDPRTGADRDVDTRRRC